MSFCPSQSNSPFAPWNQEEEPLAFVDIEGSIHKKYNEGLFPIYGDDLHDLILEKLDSKYLIYSLEWLDDNLFVSYGVDEIEKTLEVTQLLTKDDLLK